MISVRGLKGVQVSLMQLPDQYLAVTSAHIDLDVSIVNSTRFSCLRVTGQSSAYNGTHLITEEDEKV